MKFFIAVIILVLVVAFLAGLEIIDVLPARTFAWLTCASFSCFAVLMAYSLFCDWRIERDTKVSQFRGTRDAEQPVGATSPDADEVASNQVPPAA